MNYNRHQFRQADFIPAEQVNKPLYLIGAGGIGSPTAMVLSKMGFTDLTVFDPDQVEEHNVGSQLYHTDQEEEYKVDALERFVENLKSFPVNFPPTGKDQNILQPFSTIISGVDSMTARQEIWDYVKKQKLVNLYIDARMGLDIIRIYALDPTDAKQVKFYEANLYPDSEGEELPCSAKSVAYNGFFAASVIGGIVSAHVRKAHFPLETIGDMSEFRLAPTV